MSNIIVMGSFVIDLMGRTPHLPKAGETVKGNTFKIGPGGKGANQAVAAHRAGADIKLITKIGKDEFGELAKNNFIKEKMDISHIFEDSERETGAALIMVDENTSENKIAVIPGACENITDKDIEASSHLIKNCKYFLTQLETNVDSIEKTIKMASESGATVIFNPAPIQPIQKDILKYVDIITPNEVEASILTNMKVETIEEAKIAAKKLQEMGVTNVVITLGSKGCYVKTSKEEKHIPSFKVNAIDTTGAGDAFNGGFVTALSEGKDIFESAIFGNAVAALSVTKLGTAPAMPYRNEIEVFIKNIK